MDRQKGDIRMPDLSKEQLAAELAEMRRRVAALEAAENGTRADRGGTRAEQGHPASRHRKPAPGLLRHRPRRPLPDAECRQQAHWGDAIGKRPEDVAGTEENISLWLGEQSTRLRRGEDRRRSGTRRQRRKTLLPQRHRPDPGGRPNRRDSRHQHRHHRAEAR